ncbi:hypothetical protein MUP77_09995, partial [Candidatus Bathyarchaeota archaeon]|nr:hypothetical protein [Candidatus Bathyarchaeota archaeon]
MSPALSVDSGIIAYSEKYGLTETSIKRGVHALKQGVHLDEFEIEIESKEKQDLSCGESVLSEVERVVSEIDSEMAFESGLEINNSGSLLRKYFYFHPDYGEWELPGHGEQYADCGEFGWHGCLEHGVVQKYQRSCDRAECPICYESWASRGAKRIVHRLKGSRGRWGNPIHISFNPAPCLWLLPKKILTRELYRVAKRLGIEGGTFIFHPKRQNEAGNWFVSIHWHGLVYGWHRGFHIRGWVVKNHGVRRSEKERFTTARYQLSHAGVHASEHTTVWFGSCSYNKMKVESLPREKKLCP